MALIYIVEDDTNIREIETYALKNSGYQIEECACAKDFYGALEKKQPDLVLMDVMLPDEDGVEIVKKMRNRDALKRVPVIMVTAKTTELDKVKGLDSGADDYLTKPFGVMELISRVKALLRRSLSEVEEKNVVHGEIELDLEKRTVSVGNVNCELTYKEFELLKFLMQNVGIVMSRDIIMERIWGIDFMGESRTLDVHIKTLRQKLQDAGSCIKTVRNVGYILE